ncbi:hypothetical protein [Desulfofundulus thermobenzoicus]|nr:hypothetical protein [Desulfofundulus thermobenzoicus]
MKTLENKDQKRPDYFLPSVNPQISALPGIAVPVLAKTIDVKVDTVCAVN